jgi:PKHD-type hydroxylase
MIMMLHITNVLTKIEVAHIRQQLRTAEWHNGATTAGAQAIQRKQNLQLPSNAPLALELGQYIKQALQKQPLFISACLPNHILDPLFNRYEGGGTYGNHVDGAIHVNSLSRQRLRTDVSTTVFLSEPEEYEGGELIVEDTYGCHEVKLAAGDAIIYPATSLHRVEPVTQGTRFASFLWTQSMVRDDWQRTMLFNLDMTIINLREKIGDTEEVVNLTSHYHNLLRQWAEC